MPLYFYKAVNRDGETQESEREATDEAALGGLVGGFAFRFLGLAVAVDGFVEIQGHGFFSIKGAGRF